jgi:ADP-heptose:LPS heptosyltransferase
VEILILHPGGLGDIILSLPAVALLRSKFSSARITIAGNIDHLAPVISCYAESIVSLSILPLHHLHTNDPLPEAEKRFWKSFDRIVSWTGAGDPEFTRKFQEIHPGVCIASWRPAPGESRHVSQLFIDSLGTSIPPRAQAVPALIFLDSKLREEGKQWLTARGWNGRDLLTALHPGAGSQTKRWPLARFIELARHQVFQKKRKLLIIEGPAEQGLAKEITQALPANAAIPMESVNLNLLAAVVAQCAAFIGNDSGIAHLAAALGIPSIVLFGPTLPRHWAPLGKHVTVLRNARGCEACASSGPNHTCLEDLTLEEVVQNANS